MMSLTWTLEVIQSMLKVPFRICLEASFHSSGPRMIAIVPVAKGVLEAWEKCSRPWDRRAFQVAAAWMWAFHVVFSRSAAFSEVHTLSSVLHTFPPMWSIGLGTSWLLALIIVLL
jgi:hypothetical protein